MSNLVTNSQNSQIQSLKPNNLLNFIETPEEYAIAISVQQSVAVKDLKEATPLVKLVGKWRAYVGLPKEDVTQELAIVVQYIRESWGMLTLQEIELAINLSISRKIDDCEFYGFFSPMYVGKVLGSYMYYRKITMADAIRRKEKFEQTEAEKNNKPTPEQEAQVTQELVLGFYKEYKKKGQISDPFNLTYTFLRKHKWLKVSEQDIKESMGWAENKYELQKGQKDVLVGAITDDKDLEIKRHARNYLVAKYFGNVDIDVVINNIKPELFT